MLRSSAFYPLSRIFLADGALSKRDSADFAFLHFNL